MSWRADILTLFPDMFPGPLGFSLAGRALERGIWSCEAHDLRAHGQGRHRAVDDTPFGGGAGMVMRADVLDTALSALPALDGRPV
ncbi:MAG: tRNA (guanosine(37)-N1)-methyltransferase TrmD, partial [Gluconobacter cerinus]